MTGQHHLAALAGLFMLSVNESVIAGKTLGSYDAAIKV